MPFAKGHNTWNKGIHTGIVPKSAFKKGYTPKTAFKKGHKPSPIIIEKNKSRTGENHWAWIADRSKLKRTSKQGERRTSIYIEWRKRVWARDGWKCKIDNSDCKGRMETHHILSWSEHPELRYELNNGITLCHYHHPYKREDEKKMIPIFQEMVLRPAQELASNILTPRF